MSRQKPKLNVVTSTGFFKKKWQSQMSKDDLRPLGRFDCTLSQKKILNTLVESVVHTTAFM